MPKAKSGRRRDPLVQIKQDVLQALLEKRRMSIAQLAKRSGELEQTLAHIIRTPGARCQRGRLKRIARALNVPEQMLTGDPFAIPGPSFFPEGFEYRYSVSTALEASRFITRVIEAITRDLDSDEGQRDLRLCLAPRAVVETAIQRWFFELMMISEWRQRFIRWDRAAHEARGYLEPAAIKPWEGDIQVMTPREGAYDFLPAAQRPEKIFIPTPLRPEKDPEHEAAVVGIIRGLEHVLSPWFEGAAKLDYRALRDFVHLPAHPFAPQNEVVAPTSPLAALDPQWMRPREQSQPETSGGSHAE